MRNGDPKTTWDCAERLVEELLQEEAKDGEPLDAASVREQFLQMNDCARGLKNRVWLYIYTDHLFECGPGIGRVVLALAKLENVIAAGGCVLLVSAATREFFAIVIKNERQYHFSGTF